jgi:hypothetical protein
MSVQPQADTITTQVPSRLDRLPWSKFHWRVVVGLGGVWILDASKSRWSAMSPSD